MQMFYILSIKWSKPSDTLVWYGKNNSGYTSNLNEAGQYGADVVNEDPNRYNNDDCVAIPVEVADTHAVTRRVIWAGQVVVEELKKAAMEHRETK